MLDLGPPHRVSLPVPENDTFRIWVMRPERHPWELHVQLQLGLAQAELPPRSPQRRWVLQVSIKSDILVVSGWPHQLCDQMIFNHDPPRCVGCQGCGGSLHCGMKCNALVAEKIEGYYVCTTIGQHSTTNIAPIDEKDLHKGVVVKMSASNPTNKCSLSVFVFCDPSRTHGLHSIDKHGTCDYVTELWHPSGCANIISIHGKGLGWFGTLIITILCLFGGYLLAGSAYRYFFLGIRGLDVIPNMEFWLHLLEILQSFLGSLVGRWRRRSQDSQNPYHHVRR